MGILALATVCHAATVTNLKVLAQKGQAFLTFTEIPGAGVTYRVYRSTQPITSVAGLSPIATLAQGSGFNLYTNQAFVITDLGSPLPSQTGLLVWTTAVTGSYYYAVTNSIDSGLISGVNVTATPASEEHWAVPGSVQLRTPYDRFEPGSERVVEYFAWEDYATWDHGYWPYYGHRYNVIIPPSLQAGATYPLVLVLHPAGDSGYREPPTGGWAGAISVAPADNTFQFSSADPYTGTNHTWSLWYGWKRSTDGAVINTTERRAIRYAMLTRQDPTFQVDPTRIHVAGASLGGGGAMHLAYHYPKFFASAVSSIGWPDPSHGGLPFDAFYAERVENGVLWKDWNDQRWLVENRSPLAPPIIYTFAKDDNILSAAAYPDLLTATEQKKNAHVAKWMNVGHNQFYLNNNASWDRFKVNEAYPAFANASNSDAVSAPEGQRNQYLDWSSALHSLGLATEIADTASSFGMTFLSLVGDATADVTIRNAQSFLPVPGETVTWTNALQTGGTQLETGIAVADSNGLVTIRLQIRSAGNRLTVRRASGLTPPAPPSNLRIIR
jgi:S-formylglutathione hydrolase FrmB